MPPGNQGLQIASDRQLDPHSEDWQMPTELHVGFKIKFDRCSATSLQLSGEARPSNRTHRLPAHY